MTLEDLGYNTDFENYRNEQKLDSFTVARVISEHKERYMVKTADKEYDAEIIGNLRFTAQERADFPAVGDWVAISEFDDSKALIHAVYPRKSILERQTAGKKSDKQIIATNIDIAFIVQATDRDFNINRIERYMTICNKSAVKPVIILNKIDLLDTSELETLMTSLKERINNVPIYPISNSSLEGIEPLKEIIEKGKTYCLLGSSGVGKSSLINTLLGKDFMKTDEISETTNRGKHVTTHRELIVIDNGGIIIDNPGMREVGIADSAEGIEATFESISEFAHNCRFKDCTHTSESGCAVIEAVEKGEIDRSSYENYLRMEREKKHFEMNVAEKRKKDKDFGKIVKNFKKIKNHKKF